MNKTILIAGGAKSLGKFLANKFNEKGFQVIVFDIDEQELSKLKNESSEIETFTCDLTSEKEVIEGFKFIKNKFKSLDYVIYNAGYAKSSKIDSFSEVEFDKCYRINLLGYFLVAREAAKLMIENKVKGSIIQINSKSGRVGSKFNSGYSAAKFGGVGLTQSLALDLATDGIRVNALMLGNLLDSDMFESLIPAYAKKLNINENEVKDYYKAKVPMNRGCDFEDVFNVAEFYLSEKASYCTGQSINITGGQVM
ncbi:sorbitol-6-phosphate 2-dehydrogenase [Spiroplasma chinense]|uniref:Sorbitol-6-phosphate 2-dehydrogenase n=1 Tax=Spiroplasma chinense TaxID=216932 RepID=A0A5B9Y320_9MOLU|nr:sorbitol-6-phosphate dehydrogenase [Spiroplasma chinense]QEH61464.1 sorbitol-6-phosphate 2-dehydrogenase [Spiroplasma chinense]